MDEPTLPTNVADEGQIFQDEQVRMQTGPSLADPIASSALTPESTELSDANPSPALMPESAALAGPLPSSALMPESAAHSDPLAPPALMAEAAALSDPIASPALMAESIALSDAVASPAMMAEAREALPSRRGGWRRVGAEVAGGIQTLFSAAVYATLIVTFGFQVARVDGLSMAPTLEDHDRLIVNKLAYEIGEPLPGDIVMLYYPLNPEKMFVKRVIAKEGDRVQIVEGRVYVNDVPLHDDYVPAEFRSHDDLVPTVIRQGYYFVMGDHRNNSSDSRHWGQVPKKYIVGKVKVRWWPLQDARIFQ